MQKFLRRALAGFAALTMLLSTAAAETLSPNTPAPATVPSETPAAVQEPAVSPQPSPAIAATQVVESAIEDDGRIRVLLRSLGRADALHLTVEGLYALEGDAGFRFVRGAKPVLTAQDGAVWLEAGGLLVCLGESVTLTRHAAEGDSGLYIAESEKDALYCGDLTVSVEDGALRCVLELGIEEYLYGVVAYEMSDSFPIEALKAQAVAARTYAMRRKYAAGTRDYDVVDTTADQVFKGYDPQYANVIAAVDATCGVVGTVNGGFAECYYTASNGGQIARPGDIWGGADDGSVAMRDDPFDLENPRSLVNSVSFSADLSDCAALRRIVLGKLDGDVEFVQVDGIEAVDAQTEGSRMYRTLRFDVTVRRMAEPTPDPAAELATEEPWSLFVFVTPTPEPVWVEEQVSVEAGVYDEIKDGLGLGLNGKDYELVDVIADGDGFAIEMRRFGHGAGMSQRGAQWMAGEYGYEWTEILNFYYPGMDLERIAWPEEALPALAPVRGYPRPEPTAKPTPAPLPEPADGEWIATVTLEDAGSTLNVREAPSTGAKVLEKLAQGRQVIVCSEPDPDGWTKIRTAEIEGYCLAEYLN